MGRLLPFKGLVLSGGVVFFLAAAAARQILPLDEHWKFIQSDVRGAEQGDFDDSRWASVSLPHDWSIAGPFAETNKTVGAGAFLPSGVAWYRHDVSDELRGQSGDPQWRVEFDGVMQNSDVWLNGHHLDHRPNGYVGFACDLTPYLTPGKANVLAVRCDTSAQPASRWYSGAGIYRHVRLVQLAPVHIVENGVFVTTPELSASNATVQVQTTVTNQSAVPHEILVRTALVSPEGRVVATVETSATLAASAVVEVRQQVVFARPQLWSPEAPQLYQALSTISSRGSAADEVATRFGIREATFTPEVGFLLNGKKVLLQGVCLHQDGGAFGVAVPLAIWADRLQTLRSLGVNAIRTAHNPPAPEFLDLCDRLGLLVMDEFFDCWTVRKNPFDYHLYFNEWSQRDAAAAVRRDRNHPSVILYSIGNEIHDTPQPDLAIPIARGLAAVCHENDPTRPVTQALFRPNVSGDYTNGLADTLDVVGTNYRDNELLAAQRARPGIKIVNTEQIHDRRAWLWQRDNPSLAGQFLWTGVDYLGESRHWPRVGYAGGLLDRTGAVKPMAFERQSWWTAAPMVRLVRRTASGDKMPGDPGYGGAELHTQVQFADWTPRSPAPHTETVEAYSNCGEVELFLNGQSLGAQKINADASPRVWQIRFVPGTLQAVARNGGKVVATDELRTAGNPARIQLNTQNATFTASRDAVAIVRATVVDADGIPVPQADDVITFSVSGPGTLAAVDNGDNDSHELFQVSARQAYHGTCAAFIKATRPPGSKSGRIEITARAAGLKSATLDLASLKEP